MGYLDRDREGWGISGGDDYANDYEENLAKARKTWGGWLFVASLILGGLLAFSGYSPTDGSAIQDMIPGIFILLTSALAAFFAWRVRSGKGWLAGSLMLAWWAVEIVGKLTGGTLNVGWAIFHLAGMANLFLGVKACWELRGEAPSSDEPAPELSGEIVE